MTDPSVGVKDLLEAASIGTFAATSGWGIFIGKMPTKPDTAIAIMITGGTAPNPKYLLDYPSVQVMVRGAPNGYVDVRAKAQAVKDALLGLPSQVINSDKWVMVNMIGDITNMGHDANNCPMFSVNFSLIIEPSSSTGNRIAL